MKYSILILLLAFSPGLHAQNGVEEPSPLVVMNLAAHPDDEDGRTLAYYRHAKNAVAYSVIFTRGEGGQNEIGPELYAELGALRTEETERAARLLGTQLLFLNFEDFGYSKSAEETYRKWGGEDVVTARLVRLIRKLKPDVLFTNHDTVTVGTRTQHGHHQAVGNVAYQAFELAADPTYHPEQLEEPGVYLWQPSRLFLRSWSRPNSFDTAVPVGEINPETGESYAEMAMRALAEHESQGMDFFVGNRWRGGGATTYFTLYRSATEVPVDSVDLAAGLPENTEAEPDVSYMIDSGRLPVISREHVRTDTRFVIPGGKVNLTWPDSLFSTDRPKRWEFYGPAGLTWKPPVREEDGSYRVSLTVPTDVMPTWPRAVYQYERFRSTPPFYYVVRDSLNGSAPASGYIPVEITRRAELDPPEEVVLVRPGTNRMPVSGTVYDRVTKCVYVTVSVMENGDDEPIGSAVVTQPVDENGRFHAELTLDLPASLQPGEYRFHSEARLGKIYTTESRTTARALDTDVADGLRVGIVESYDGSLSEAVRVLGIEPVLLDSAALATGGFSELHTILVDIRGYFVRPDLRTHNRRLLDWVESGGHLIVNYQKTFEWNPGYSDPFDDSRTNPPDFAPYRLVLGRDRVTREDAPVRILVPRHDLFHRPNVIRSSDWEGWVQERGLYFPESYSDEYTELFAMSDPGEPALHSSTLLASYGAGTYLYTALGWYRQLKQYHPGAFRMFANMISLPLVE